MVKDGVVGIIPFRTGSKGLINKNFRFINEMPLWERAAVQGVRTCDQVICSSDADNLVSATGESSIKFDRRPAELAKDTTEMRTVIQYLIRKYELLDNTCVLLQPTSPLRSDKSICKALDIYAEGSWSMVMSVKNVPNNCLKYGFKINGSFKSINQPDYCFANRQMLPNLVSPNGAIYIFNGRKFLEVGNFPNENIGLYQMDELESLDIDTEEDFAKVEDFLK